MTNKFLQDSKGNQSSKRLWGSILLGSGIIFSIILFAYSLYQGAADAATADALATACMVWGPEEGKRFIETYRSENEFERVEALFIYASESGAMVTWQTKGWDAALSANS